MKHTAQDSNLYAIRPYKGLRRVSTRRQTTINVLQYGAPSRTRTGTPYSGGFSYHYSFRYHFCLWSGLYLHHCSRFRCLPSSLYTFNSISTEAWLGISILQPSPNLTDSTPKISLRALKLSISPLRLPIPSSGHDIFKILKSVADFSAYMSIILYILFLVKPQNQMQILCQV